MLYNNGMVDERQGIKRIRLLTTQRTKKRGSSFNIVITRDHIGIIMVTVSQLEFQDLLNSMPMPSRQEDRGGVFFSPIQPSRAHVKDSFLRHTHYSLRSTHGKA
jgi:hypothetical protein